MNEVDDEHHDVEASMTLQKSLASALLKRRQVQLAKVKASKTVMKQKEAAKKRKREAASKAKARSSMRSR